MEEEVKKIGFFKRLKISIFNLEDYKIFVKEKFSKAFKYLLLLVVIATLVLSISSVIKLSKEFEKLVEYVKNDFPDFSYAEGNLTVNDKVSAYDEEYQARLIADTRGEEVTEDEVKAYKKETTDSLYSVILLKDKVIYSLSGVTYEANYTDLLSTLNLDTFSKNDVVDNYLNSNGMAKINVVLWIYAFLTIFMMNFLTLLEDLLVVAVFGFVATKIIRVSLKFGQVASIAVYSLTLSVILSTIYSVAYSFGGFEIKYFTLMYMIIAYIYIIASIMMMKPDLDRNAGEAVPVEGKILDEKEKEDLEKEKEKEEEPKQEDKKDENKSDEKNKKDNNNKENTDTKTEPDGSDI